MSVKARREMPLRDPILSFISILPNGPDILSDIPVSFIVIDIRRNKAEKSAI